jgi:hypothetical protein
MPRDVDGHSAGTWCVGINEQWKIRVRRNRAMHTSVKESFWILVFGLHQIFSISTVSQMGFHGKPIWDHSNDCRDQRRMNLLTALFVLSIFGT